MKWLELHWTIFAGIATLIYVSVRWGMRLMAEAVRLHKEIQDSMKATQELMEEARRPPTKEQIAFELQELSTVLQRQADTVVATQREVSEILGRLTR